MNPVLRIFLILVLLVIAMVCAAGFLATFQPMPIVQKLFFQLLYGGGGVVCMFIIMRLAMPRLK